MSAFPSTTTLGVNTVTRATVLTCSKASARNEVTVGDCGAALCLVGKTLYVDSANGNDSIAVRGRADLPYLTPAAAVAAASSGDLIRVGPGSYTCTSSLAKDGVNWDLANGCTITRTDTTASGTFDDGGSAMVFTISGNGDIVRQVTGATSGILRVIRSSNAGTFINVSARNLYFTGTGTCDAIAIEQDNGTVYGTLTGDIHNDGTSITGIQNGIIGLYWVNKPTRLTCKNIRMNGAMSYGVVSNAATGIFTTGDMDVTADEISGDAAPIMTEGDIATAFVGIDVHRLRGGTQGVSVLLNGSERVYLRGQKIFGAINNLAFGNQLYVTSQKITALGNGTDGAPSLLFDVSGGNARYDIMHWDTNGTSGETVQTADFGGTGHVYLNGGHFLGGAAKGFQFKDGNVHIKGMRIDTSGNGSTHAIAATSGSAGAIVDVEECHLTSAGGSSKDMLNSTGLLNVVGGRGTGSGGAYVTTGSINYLAGH